MIRISIEIGFFHPAIVSALTELKADHEKVLKAVNAEISEAMESDDVEQTGVIKGKVEKKKGKVSITASGKLTGVKFDSDSPAGLLARCHWYLQGSLDLFMRVETVTLPASVKRWVSAERFALPVPAPATPA